MPKVKSSIVWKFFQPKPDAIGIAVCNICGNELSYKATSNNLRRHVQRKHPFAVLDDKNQAISVVVSADGTTEGINLMYPETMEMEIEAPNDTTEDESICTKDPLEPSLIDTFLKRENTRSVNDVDAALLRLFTVDFQPISIVEDGGFQSLLNSLNYQLPSRKTITDSLLPAAYQRAYNASKNILEDITSITLTIEQWTSNTENLMAVTGHFINNNFEKKLVFLDLSSFEENPTSSNISAELARIVDEWYLQEKVLIVISDNANNLTQAITDLQLHHFGCFAHNLNSIAQDALRLIKNHLDKIRTIVGYFERSTPALSKFQYQQKQRGIPPKRLIQSVPRRWNSSFYMLERLVELEEPLRATTDLINENLPPMTAEEWHFLAEVVKILRPLVEVTEIMSKEKYVTASSVIILMDGLVHVYDKLVKQNFTQSAKKMIQSIQDKITNRLEDLERSELLVLTTFLDPRFKNIGFSNEITANVAKEQIIASLTQLIRDKGEDTQPATTEVVDPEDSIWRSFDEKIATANPAANAHSKAVAEVQRYLEELPISRNENPMLWWRNNAYNLPNLSDLVKMKFIPVATSVPCDRLFTKSGQLLTDRRNRLKSSKLKSILCLNTMCQ